MKSVDGWLFAIAPRPGCPAFHFGLPLGLSVSEAPFDFHAELPFGAPAASNEPGAIDLFYQGKITA